MNPESIPSVLPLADAMKAWSDPALVTAVEIAEAPFTADECDRLQREWLAEIVQSRQRGKHMIIHTWDVRLRALGNGWTALFAHFNRKVASGEVVLWGQMEKPIPRRDGEPLPSGWAADLLYYPRRDTVIFREDAYGHVTAEQRGNAASCDERLRRARTAAGTVPLATALREWSDPVLLSEVCRCERDYTENEMAAFPVYPRLSDVQDLAKLSDRRWMLGLPDFARLLSAWRALEDDFRARLVHGEFRLQGVMTKPDRQQTPSGLPGVWAADFVFDFQRGTVSFDDTRYVAVTAAFGAGSQITPSDNATEVPEDALDSQAPVAAPVVPRPHLGGRRNARPVVEEALRAHWDDLFPKGAPADPGPWTEFADRLIKHVERSGHPRRIGFPKKETVRKHLRYIYERLLVEKGEIAPNDQ